MNLHDNHTEYINYRDPVNFRRKRRSFPWTTYNDRPAEVAAMKSHLRAAAYPRRDSAPAQRTKSARALLHLSRDYDTQARDNFAKEAIAFAIITIVAVAWPFLHGMRALALL